MNGVPIARRNPGPQRWSHIFIILGIAVLAVSIGALMALGSPKIALVVGSLIVAPAIIFMRPTLLVASFMVLSLVVEGVLQYFFKFPQAQWLPSLATAAMLVRLPMDTLRRTTHSSAEKPIGPISIVSWISVILFAMSVAINTPPIMQDLVGVRHYILPIALVAVISLSTIERSFWLKMWGALPYVLIIQLPISAYQHFFVAGRRGSTLTSGISWDAVVGTLGGDPDGGGASGALALLLAFGIASVVVLRRAQLFSKTLAWTAIICSFITVGLAEIKVMIFFMPIALLVSERRRVLRSPVNAIIWIAASVAFGAALLSTYNAVHWSQAGLQKRDLSEVLAYTFKAEENTRFFSRVTGEVSRIGALVKWWEENPLKGDVAATVLGHGPAGSKVSSLFGRGTAAEKYAFVLTTSSASMLLWDLGLAGFICFVTLCGVTFWLSIRSAKQARVTDPKIAAINDSCAIAVALITAGLFYNNDVINTPGIQAILFLAIGFVSLNYGKNETIYPPQLARNNSTATSSVRNIRTPARW